MAAPLASAATASPSGKYFRTGPASEWVEPIEAEYGAPLPKGGIRDGAYYLLLDRQVQAGASGDEDYRHYAIAVKSPAAVESHARITVSVDPASQDLVIHFIRVVRGAQAIDQLGRARITELPQEDDLEARIYNGHFDIDVLLEDVRVGDVVEYAYSLRTRERVVPGHYSGWQDFAWTEPVRYQRLRVRHPADRAMQVRAFGAPAEKDMLDRGGMHELRYEWRDLPAVSPDPDTPAWYVTWPYLQFSDFPSWTGLAGELNELYRVPARSPDAVSRLVATIQEKGGGSADQALRALQYVQDEIRYTSISLGLGAFEPTAPDRVLERRFGDCKDKSLLLVTLLRALGVDAHVALVHTSRGRRLKDALPSPYSFDHAIVQARIGDAVYWLDGTATRQAGPLSRIAPPNFGYALVLGAEGAALQEISPPGPDSDRRIVTWLLDARAGLSAPALLTVATTYRGSGADYMRDGLARTPPAEREKTFLNYYAKQYPGITSLDPHKVVDDAAANEVVVTEKYKLPVAFAAAERGQLQLTVWADELARYSEAVASSVRTAPLSLSYPAHVSQIIRVLLPEDWALQPSKVAIDNPAFRYRSQAFYRGREVTLTYDYVALADHVPVESMGEYLRDRERMNDDLQFSFSHAAPLTLATFAVAPLPLVVLLLALAAGIWLARWINRYDPPPAEAPLGAPIGIRGWLALFAFGVVVRTVSFGQILWSFATYVEANAWLNLPEFVSESAQSWARPALLALVALSAAVVPTAVYSAIAFFQRRTSVPRLMITTMWGLVLVESIIGVTLLQMGISAYSDTATFWTDVLREAFSGGIWTAYWLYSKRVRATFDRRLTVADSLQAPPQEPSQPAAA